MLSKYIIMAMANDSASIFVRECIKRPRQTARTFVLLRACALELEDIISVRCSMSSYFYVHALFYHPNTNTLWHTMAITTLRWYLCVDWMHETGVVLARNEQRVRLYCYVCTWTWRCYWCLIQYGVVVLPSCAIYAVQIHYNGNDDSALIYLRWLNVLNGCCVDPGRADCAFVLLRVRLNLKILLLLNECVMRSYSHPFDMLAMATLRWSSYVEYVVLTLNKQIVRIYLYIA